jgi:ATP-binding cassette subfamily B protein
MLYLIKFLWEYKGRVVLGLLALFIVDGAQLVVPLIIRRAVDDLATGLILPQNLVKYSLIIVGLAIIVAIFRFFWRYFIIGTARKIEENLRNRIYHHLLKLQASLYEKAKTGDLMAHAVNDVDAVRMALGMGVVASADALIISFFALAAMITISPLLTLYTLLPLPLLTFIVLGFGRMIHKRFRDVQAAFSDLTERVREALSGIRVLKSFVQEKGETEHFKRVNEDFVKINMKLVKVWGIFFPIISFLAGTSLAIVLLFGGRKVVLGDITLGDFVAFSSYLGMMVWPMIAVGWVVNLIQRGTASIKRINIILATKPDIEDTPDSFSPEIEGEILIKNLNFSYDGNSKILEDINIHIKRGMTLGIIGRTGSGKSTLVHLIPRIYDPPSNSIFIDGVEIKRIKIQTLRSSIGFVPQESFLFSTTIKENITFGRDIDENEVIMAAKLASIYDEIMDFPNGFETPVGERGVTLSGGQKQRIALARAILKNPKILILDDSLSQVDAETEEKILKNLKKNRRGMTTIIISHRVSAIKDSDYIIVMDEGKIIEEGIHEELIKNGGLYQRFYEMQKLEETLIV